MKKRLFTLLFALMAMVTIANAQVVLNETNFPDANFRTTLADEFGISEGDEITDAMIQQMTELSVGGGDITDLTGIEHFIALTYLYCGSNRLTSLDVSKNTALTELFCEFNRLTSLNVSGCTALTYLNCEFNRLASLDVSGCTALTYLVCQHNQLISLDISGCNALTQLDCAYNQLTSLDVTGCNSLTQLDCYNNQINGAMMDAFITSLPTVNTGAVNVINWGNEKNICTSIQVAAAQEKGWTMYHYNDGKPFVYEGSEPDLEDNEKGLEINEINFPDSNFRNYLRGLNWAKNGFFSDNEIKQIKEMDISGRYIEDLTGIEFFTALASLDCSNNSLTSLDLSGNAALTKLVCNGTSWKHIYGEGLHSINVSRNTSLKHLSCNYNLLTSLDLSNNTALEYLDCDYSSLTSLDLSNNTALRFLHCRFNQLSSLDLSKNNAIVYLDCRDNKLTSLDLSSNTALEDLNCDSNLLTQLDISKNIGLKKIDCSRNPFTSLDFSGHPSLTFLNCSDYGNKVSTLASLNVSNCPKLKALYCEGYYNNRGALSTLNAWNCVSLDTLNCMGNQLTSLTIMDCPSLNYLECSYNELTGLDLSGKQYLTEVKCRNNQLLSLSVRDCPKLEMLDCCNNHISSLGVSTNIALSGLYCANNQIAELYVAKNRMLNVLQCDNNQLTSLDVSENWKLAGLTCSKNHLRALDVSENKLLTDLICNNNQLKSIKMSNGRLKDVWCFGNLIGSIAMEEIVNKLPKSNVWGGKLGFIAIDTKDSQERNVCTKTHVSIAAKKDWVVYDYNGGNEKPYEGREPFQPVPLTESNFRDNYFRAALSEILSVSEGDDITEEVIEGLTMLDVSDKSIADLSGIEYFTALTTLYCQINQISDKAMTSLIAALPDLSGNEAKGLMLTEETNPRKGALYALDFTDENEQNVCTAEHVEAANAKGWTVYCKRASGWEEYNGAKSGILLNEVFFPDANFRSELSDLFEIVEGDEVTENMIATGMLMIQKSSIADLAGIEYFTNLRTLLCGENPLTLLDVSKNTKLQRLNCKGYGQGLLASLNVSGCAILETLECDDNQLTSIDASNNPELYMLSCNNNQLSSLDFSKNTKLESLKCSNNSLTSLVVSDNASRMKILECDLNNINGETMQNLVESLPTVTNGELYVIDTSNPNENNEITKQQVSIAKEKGWTVYDKNGGSKVEYAGIDIDTPTDINSVDSGELTNDSWYTIDGKKLAGEPKEKGIYIRNGMKVVK